MFAWVIGLWTTMSPATKKWLGYAAICVVVGGVIFWSILLYGVHQYEKGAQEKAVKLYNEKAKTKAKEWELRDRAADLKDAEIADRLRVVSAAESQLMAASSALAQARLDANNELKKALARIQSAAEENHALVLAVPDDQLVNAVRAKLAELARAKAAPGTIK